MPPLANSPDSFGAHRYACFYVQGPAPYTQISVTSPPSQASGGQLISSADSGVSRFECVLGGASDSGLYFVRAIPTSASNGRSGQQTSTYRLAWYVASTGVEVPTGFTLSAEYVRLIAFGIS